ncbi:MAG: hypothetical protein VKL39_18320 [Leptolyngbyaceae bacterium]|nr:hypothetical protein [Leptolyngbyaceae bacterium]
MPSSLIIDQQQLNEQSIVDALLGAAVFDLTGLPKTYLTSRDDIDVGWIETIFQALGLRSLLTSFLFCEDFQHAVVHSDTYSVVVMVQPLQYSAVLLNRSDYEQLSDTLLPWMQTVELTMLTGTSHFCDR